MTAPRLAGLLIALSLSGAASCGTPVDLSKDLEVTDVSTGFFDVGIDPATKWNKLVPGITFKLKNVSSEPITNVQLTVAYWVNGDDGEKDSKLLRGIDDAGLAAGASTDVIVARSTVGFNLEGARASLFDHSGFRDWTVKLFAKRGGRIVPIGEHAVERRLVLSGAGSAQ